MRANKRHKQGSMNIHREHEKGTCGKWKGHKQEGKPGSIKYSKHDDSAERELYGIQLYSKILG